MFSSQTILNCNSLQFVATHGRQLRHAHALLYQHTSFADSVDRWQRKYLTRNRPCHLSHLKNDGVYWEIEIPNVQPSSYAVTWPLFERIKSTVLVVQGACWPLFESSAKSAKARFWIQQNLSFWPQCTSLWHWKYLKTRHWLLVGMSALNM